MYPSEKKGELSRPTDSSQSLQKICARQKWKRWAFLTPRNKGKIRRLVLLLGENGLTLKILRDLRTKNG